MNLILTKTDKVLRALIGVCQNPEVKISERDLCEFLDNPSRAQKYKLIAELLTPKEYRPAILVKYEEDSRISYGLNEEFYRLILKN